MTHQFRSSPWLVGRYHIGIYHIYKLELSFINYLLSILECLNGPWANASTIVLLPC